MFKFLLLTSKGNDSKIRFNVAHIICYWPRKNLEDGSWIHTSDGEEWAVEEDVATIDELINKANA